MWSQKDLNIAVGCGSSDFTYLNTLDAQLP